jgi:hypothetical protein
MTRDEIYDHLAKVYLGKRESAVEIKPVKKKPHVWLVINIVITAFILASVIYGLTAFLAKRNDLLQSRIIYALNSAPVKLSYSVGGDYPQVKDLKIALPVADATKFARINMSLKADAGGNPGMLKLVLTNDRAEQAVYYLQGITSRWQDYAIPFGELDLTDWRSLRDISFVVEAWNAQQTRGAVYIDNISFSN